MRPSRWNMRKKIWIVCAMFLLIFVVGIGIYLVYLGNWYQQVQTQLPDVKYQLTQLNHITLTQLPPPQGTIETSRDDYNKATTDYGVWTSVKYRKEDPNLDIQMYYRRLTERLGWTVIDWDDNGSLMDVSSYYHNDECVDVTTYSDSEGEYKIIVYHDFRKQSFSPNLPPEWYLQFQQVGKASIDHCP
jgi:hypothetical protein